MLNVLKIFLFRCLMLMPGNTGSKSETRYYWALRKVRFKKTKQAYKRHLQKLNSNSVCIDLGANVGKFTNEFLEKMSYVYAFEPDPWAFEQLKKNVGKNPKATLINKAIGTEDGRLTLYRDPAFEENTASRSQGTSAFSSELWGKGTPSTFNVEVADICRVLREIGRDIDILKIDIEGAEVALLDKLLDSPEKDLVKTIFVETHEAQMPELRSATRRLRNKVKNTSKPVIYLDWQ